MTNWIADVEKVAETKGYLEGLRAALSVIEADDQTSPIELIQGLIAQTEGA